MKKIFIIILSFLCIIEIIGCFLISSANDSIVYGNERRKENLDIFDMHLIDFNYNRHAISIGKIEVENTIRSKIIVDTYKVTFSDISQMTKNKIYFQNEVYGCYSFESNSRVMNIENKDVTFENLDSTHITLYMDVTDKITNRTDYSFTVKNSYEIMNVTNYIISFDSEKEKYKVDIFLENDGTYTTGISVTASYKKTIATSPLDIYVPKNYVFITENGPAVYKLVSNSNDQKCYKIISVEIIGTFDNYYKVLGDLKDENIIILPTYN